MPRFGTAFCTRAASACLSPRALVVILGLSFAQPAHAYLDPASGGLLLQAAVAGLLAGMFTLKMYWVKGRAKVLIGIGLGKKQHDKRADIAKREDKRDMDRATSRQRRL